MRPRAARRCARRPASAPARRRAPPASCTSAAAWRGDERRLLGGLGDDRIAGGQRPRRPDRTKIASGKFHGEIAHEHAAPAQGRSVRFAGGPRQLGRSRRTGARPPPRSSGRNPPPRGSRRARRRWSCRPPPASGARSCPPIALDEVAQPLQRGRPRGGRRRRPAGPGLRGRSDRPRSASSGRVSIT